MPRVLVLSIACVVVAVPLLWYCCGDQIALVSQVVYNYYGPNGETRDTRLVSSDSFNGLLRFSNAFFSSRKNAAVSPSDFKSAMIFDGISGALDADGEDLVKNVKGIFAFKVKGDKGGEATWIVDAKNGKGKVEFNGTAKPDVTFQMSDSDLFDLMSGKLNPQKAFFAVR